MNTFRRLAIEVRSDVWVESEHGRFVAVILEVAHALSRGRKPNGSALLPGVNLRVWLHDAYNCEVEAYRDSYGHAGTLASDTCELLMWDQTQRDQRTLRAIYVVGAWLRQKHKKPLCRGGDWKYQESHATTRIKRRAAYRKKYIENETLSWYDYDYY